MANNDRWFRLNATWAESEWLEALAWADRAVWVEMLAYVKTNGSKGRCKAISPARFAGFRMIPIENVEALIDAATQSGALIIEDGQWIIAKWSDYQDGDGSSADRMRRKRLRDAELASQDDATSQVTECDGVTSRDAVTPSRRPLTPDPLQTTNVVLRDLGNSEPIAKKPKPPAWAEFAEIDLPDSLNSEDGRQTWRDFCKHRSEKGSKLTSTMAASLLKKLGGYSPAIACGSLRQTIDNGWQGVFPEKYIPSSSPPSLSQKAKATSPVQGVDFINVELPNGDIAEFKPGFTADDHENPEAWFDRAKWGQA